MKQRMAEAVARFAKWEPKALEQRIAFISGEVRAAQHEMAAMRKAQRVQRKREADDGKRTVE